MSIHHSHHWPCAVAVMSAAIGFFDCGAAMAASEEMPAEVIAAQIRRQGYDCGKANKATRDSEDSKADEPVWILECDNAKYKVRLVPDQAADVTRIDDAKKDESAQ